VLTIITSAFATTRARRARGVARASGAARGGARGRLHCAENAAREFILHVQRWMFVRCTLQAQMLVTSYFVLPVHLSLVQASIYASQAELLRRPQAAPSICICKAPRQLLAGSQG
jgi:hypothetical protein